MASNTQYGIADTNDRTLRKVPFLNKYEEIEERRSILVSILQFASLYMK